MPKFDEDTECHFFPDEECRFLLTEDDMKESLKNSDWEDGGTLARRPYEYTDTCLNCLIAQILGQLKEMNK